MPEFFIYFINTEIFDNLIKIERSLSWTICTFAVLAAKQRITISADWIDTRKPLRENMVDPLNFQIFREDKHQIGDTVEYRLNLFPFLLQFLIGVFKLFHFLLEILIKPELTMLNTNQVFQGGDFHYQTSLQIFINSRHEVGRGLVRLQASFTAI